MQRVLIFGSAGQLGAEFVRVFAGRGDDVRALTRADVDLNDSPSIEAAITAFAPNLVVNCAAYNLVDKAESEPTAAMVVNGLAVGAMSRACHRSGARLLHISTDYVFDGEAGRAYAETDETHPVSAYGVSKLAGELYARAYREDALVVRTCGVFGPAGRATPRGNFPELMLRLAAEGKPIRVVNDAHVSPTYAPALAERCVALAGQGATGLFHIGGGEAITWYHYARLLFECAGLNPQVEPVDRTTFPTPARRPRFSALNNAKADTLTSPMPGLRDAINSFLRLR
jgi:dTDP-4-dehydrorhamnose reductase